MDSDAQLTVPDYPASEAAITVMSEAVEIIGKVQKDISADVQDFMEKQQSFYGWKPVKFNQQALSKLLHRNHKPHLSRSKRRAIWVYLHAKHLNAIERAKARLSYAGPSGNQIVDAIHTQINGSDPFNNAIIRSLIGTYVLIRPFFYQTDELMKCELVCGIGDDASRFQLKMRFPDNSGDSVDDEVDGRIIPFGDCALFQGAFVNRRGPFVFVLAALGLHQGQVPDCAGVLLAGTEGKSPSAYWLVVMRTSERIDPAVLTRKELSKEKRLSALVRPELDKGIVRWK